MTPKKPDWFVLTEGEKRLEPKKRKRFLSIAAFGAPALLITAGILVTQSSDPNKADAESTPSPVSTVSTVSTVQTPAPQAAPKVATPVVPVNQSISAPSRFGSDDFNEHEGREHHGENEEEDYED